MKQGQFPEVLPLGSLNGQNGFKIDGEAVGDWSNFGGGIAGDVNADGYADLIIGAEHHNSNIGRSYVVFGGPGVGNSGALALASLDGRIGFKLDGEVQNDESGYGISAAGDINNDGWADVLIGACYHGGTGRSYLVFGGPGIGSSGLLPLANLNGKNGFKLDGEATSSWTGYALSGIGDVNGDGVMDLAIGGYGYASNTGRSYVVFGGLKIGGSGLLALSSLNGINGFKLTGETAGDRSGYPVSAAGDINGDGYADVLIGADGYSAGASRGRSYVVFGGSTMDGSGMLALSSLNGKNGFKLDGEVASDTSGCSVSAAGDVNGDGLDDLLVGAYGHASQTGRSYVVFGSRDVGMTGIMALSSLNGTNGFKLDGEVSGDASGASVGAAGDINGDGIVDLLVGAPNHAGKGRSYVVFGGPDVGSGLVALSSLNGANGFKLDGEVAGDASGMSVNTAGDINNDGVEDIIIGAYGYNGKTGRSYVVFGDIPPVLVNNSLSLYPNETVLITPGCLSAYDRNHDNKTLVFVPSNVTHGRFELISNPGKAIANFTQQQIMVGDILFVPDGTTEAPSYNITVRTTGIAYVSPTPANITFNLLQIKNNQLMINQGQTVLLTTENLSATDTGSQEDNVEFIISDLQHGQFQWINFPDQPILTFKQQNITDGAVNFMQDGSALPPCYNVTVSNGKITVGPQASLIDFDPSPVLVNNQLKINQGQTVALTTDNLLATHSGIADPQLTFIITNISNGRFMVPGEDIQSALFLDTTFGQQQILDQAVLFYQQGTDAPAYRVSVSDGRINTSPQPASITYLAKPVLQNNQFAVSRGQPVILTTDNVLATRSGQALETLQFLVPLEMTHGQYEKRSAPGVGITSFSQKEVSQQTILFMHDNSTLPPDGDLVVLDSSTGLSTDAQETHTLLLLNNHLPINQGETLTLTPEMLQAASNQASADEMVFTPAPGTVQYGNFALKSTPNYPIPSFRQSQVTHGDIVFVPDGSAKTPACFLTVSDGQPNGASGTFSCGVDFDTPPVLQHAYLKISASEVIKITDVNLKAASDFVSSARLIFEISAMKHGHFSDNDNWDIELSNFTQQQITDNQIVFITDDSGVVPEFQVSVWDGRLHCKGCPQPAQVVFDTNNSSNSLIDMKTLLSVLTSIGGIGLTWLSYFYYRRHQRIDREGSKPFAEAIHSKLGLSYVNFYDGGGKQYADLVDTMVQQLKSEKKVEIEDLRNNRINEYKRYVELFAKHMSSGKRIRTDHCGINCLGRSLNFSEFKESGKIVEEIYQELRQPEDAKEQRPTSHCWGRLFCCRKTSDQSVPVSDAKISHSGGNSIRLDNTDSSLTRPLIN